MGNDQFNENDSSEFSFETAITKDFTIIGSERSLWIFGQNNGFRILCFRVIQSKSFEKIIILIILLSNIKLALDTYYLDEPEDSAMNLASSYLDTIFTIIFTLEILIKTIALGFIYEKHSYLSNRWNILDFIIVVISLLELAIPNKLAIIKVFRSLRTLRSLRIISHNASMKIVVTALFESIFALFNVLVVLLIVWLIFAILGVSLFGGKFYQCENPAFAMKEECSEFGYNWENANSSFDNVLEAVITLFIVSSLEGWPEMMYMAVDATEPGKPLQRNFDPYAAYYFIVFILCGVFLFLNLFIGVVFQKFEEVKKSQHSIFSGVLSSEQEYWYEMQTLIPKAKLKQFISEEPKTKLKKFFFALSKNSAFDLSIIICIVLNMIQMALVYDEASAKYILVLEYINLVFTVIFLLECTIKITGLGLKGYFHQKSNKFDFFVVICSLLDLVLSAVIEDSFKFLRTGPQLARIIRVLRVTRLVRIAKALKPIQDLINILANSLPAVLNVLALLLLIFFIYAILGCYSYSHIERGEIIDDYTNFHDFGQTMVMLLSISTGENWHLIMYDCIKETNGLGTIIYFITFIAITTFVILNLFTMVIVQVHEDFSSNTEIPYKAFNKHQKHFSKIWDRHSKEYNGYKMTSSGLVNLMYGLDEGLGVPLNTDRSYIERKLWSMELPIVNNFVYYHDVLFALLKEKYGKFEDMEPKMTAKILRSQETITKEKLERIREKSARRIFDLSREKSYYKNSNFFFSQMSIRKIFKSWSSYVRIRKNERLQPISSDNYSLLVERPPVLSKSLGLSATIQKED